MTQPTDTLLGAGPETDEEARLVEVRDALESYFKQHPEPLVYSDIVDAVVAQHGFDRPEVVEMMTSLLNHGPLVTHSNLRLSWG